MDIAEAFADVAAATGAGARRARDERLARLASRVSADEREFLARIIGGEMRTGVSEGLLLEAIAAAWGVDVAAARRAALFLGDLTAVATLAAAGGAAAVAGASPRPFVPLLPMLAEIADDFPAVLAAHGGRTALEYKYDGACRCGRGACRTSRAACRTSSRSRGAICPASRSSSMARWWRSTRRDGRCRSRS